MLERGGKCKKLTGWNVVIITYDESKPKRFLVFWQVRGNRVVGPAREGVEAQLMARLLPSLPGLGVLRL